MLAASWWTLDAKCKLEVDQAIHVAFFSGCSGFYLHDSGWVTKYKKILSQPPTYLLKTHSIGTYPMSL